MNLPLSGSAAYMVTFAKNNSISNRVKLSPTQGVFRISNSKISPHHTQLPHFRFPIHFIL